MAMRWSRLRGHEAFRNCRSGRALEPAPASFEPAAIRARPQRAAMQGGGHTSRWPATAVRSWTRRSSAAPRARAQGVSMGGEDSGEYAQWHRTLALPLQVGGREQLDWQRGNASKNRRNFSSEHSHSIAPQPRIRHCNTQPQHHIVAQPLQHGIAT